MRRSDFVLALTGLFAACGVLVAQPILAQSLAANSPTFETPQALFEKALELQSSSGSEIEAIRLLRQAAAQGHGEATHSLKPYFADAAIDLQVFVNGTAKLFKSSPPMKLTVEQWEAAKSAPLEAQVELAIALLFGKGHQFETKRAQSLFELAAESGSSEALFYLDLLQEFSNEPVSEGSDQLIQAAEGAYGPALDKLALLPRDEGQTQAPKHKLVKVLFNASKDDLDLETLLLATEPQIEDLAAFYRRNAPRDPSNEIALTGSPLARAVTLHFGPNSDVEQAAEVYKGALTESPVFASIALGYLNQFGLIEDASLEQAMASYALAAPHYPWLYADLISLERRRLDIIKAEEDGPQLYELAQGFFGDGKSDLAFEFLIAASNKNDPEALYDMGEAYFQGKGFDQDFEQAKSYFEKSAKLNHARSWERLGDFERFGLLTGRVDEDKANRMYARAVYAQKPVSEQFEIGRRFFDGAAGDERRWEAERWLQSAAEQGHKNAMLYLGEFYIAGILETNRPESALEWLTKAVEAGNTEASLRLADLFFDGAFGAPDFEQAQKFYEVAARGGLDALDKLKLSEKLLELIGPSIDELTAQQAMDQAFSLMQGQSEGSDLAAATYLLEIASKEGTFEAYNELGDLYARGGNPALDFALARQWYEVGVDAGDATSMLRLAELSTRFDPRVRDLYEAEFWLLDAQAAGQDIDDRLEVLNAEFTREANLIASAFQLPDHYQAANYSPLRQFEVGANYYERAESVSDYVVSFNWIMLSVENGHQEGLSYIGDFYARGLDRSQDYVEAAAWYRKAAELGHPNGQTQLGYLYENGLGVEQSYDQAATWYRRAADQEDLTGQILMGWIYENGLGVEQSNDKAIQWYKLAADRGNLYAESALSRLQSN